MANSDPIRLCMIGAGHHSSRNIYPCFPFLQNAQVVGNADLDEERAKALAVAWGIPNSYTDYKAMLQREEPDGVVVCVGPDFHPRCAIELMKGGYHVYTEKPPATDLALCKRVLEAQKETGRICMTAFKKRFAPAYTKTKELLDLGTYGKPALVDILRTSGPYGSGNQYLLDSGIHVVDLATYLCGPVQTVNAYKGTAATYAITLTFTGTAVGTLSVTDRMSPTRGWEQITVITSESLCVQIDNSVEMIAYHRDQPVAAHKPEFTAGFSHSSTEMGFTGELQAFVDAIAQGTTPESSIAQATHTMAVLDAIERSVETRSPVDVATDL